MPLGVSIVHIGAPERFALTTISFSVGGVGAVCACTGIAQIIMVAATVRHFAFIALA
ncbi:hypothetical protein GCM10010833_16560 [Blastomonas aquatica]|uniref:Uncharacterized protein n=1 Tax=Blastomonas aquatica TaxID=1510276 RepID=A0ABQ1J7Z3_9SPHN|nr:hypothetical protein GCM10010833_16560 [Blastomonas aquatica]